MVRSSCKELYLRHLSCAFIPGNMQNEMELGPVSKEYDTVSGRLRTRVCVYASVLVHESVCVSVLICLFLLSYIKR